MYLSYNFPNQNAHKLLSPVIVWLSHVVPGDLLRFDWMHANRAPVAENGLIFRQRYLMQAPPGSERAARSWLGDGGFSGISMIFLSDAVKVAFQCQVDG